MTILVGANQKPPNKMNVFFNFLNTLSACLSSSHLFLFAPEELFIFLSTLQYLLQELVFGVGVASFFEHVCFSRICTATFTTCHIYIYIISFLFFIQPTVTTNEANEHCAQVIRKTTSTTSPMVATNSNSKHNQTFQIRICLFQSL